MLQNIIPSKVRRKILELFFQNPANTYFLREVVRLVGEEVNAVKRELDILHDSRLLQREKRTNKVFYTLNRNYLFYDEFLRIFTKTTHLGKVLLEYQTRMGKIKFAAISLKFSRKIAIKEDEIYVLFVGIMVIPEVELVMSSVKSSFGSDVNYTVMTDEEFTFRKRRRDPFALAILEGSRIMIIGDEDLLVS